MHGEAQFDERNARSRGQRKSLLPQENFGGSPRWTVVDRSKKQKDRSCDTCVIRTHAPEGIALAGQRVNHSAKVPC